MLYLLLKLILLLLLMLAEKVSTCSTLYGGSAIS
nr:MAG TPA: hypothetical protein [Crassvirales sp.]